MARPVRRSVAMCAVALLTVSGCAEKDPTAAEAGETLKLHITELMKERHALDVKITDPGGRDIPCGEGKAKRTFAATGTDPASHRTPDGLNTLLLGSLSRVATYDIVEDRGNAPIKLANNEHRTVIVLESPANGQYGVRGETECLPIA
ncbi:hypothetical protein [Planomonospora venezuelensis]|uniref:Type IV pilus biogenesis protein CpaD/CtpE n=1 Tax=Planomonospora venezuelensis TaxID=1999 RepID=A0A841D4C4_PLAVE|nr:hypothetical protein [Planomonospora venezuelensis]MBB5963238.1 type IV pilus biogenesis protein CpaD/CtpE [Planomonospora venezuelensis]